LPRLVGLHGRDEVIRIEPDEARRAGCLAYAAFAVAAPAARRGSLASQERVGLGRRGLTLFFLMHPLLLLL
jgi:hypothetical protein